MRFRKGDFAYILSGQRNGVTPAQIALADERSVSVVDPKGRLLSFSQEGVPITDFAFKNGTPVLVEVTEPRAIELVTRREFRAMVVRIQQRASEYANEPTPGNMEALRDLINVWEQMRPPEFAKPISTVLQEAGLPDPYRPREESPEPISPTRIENS